MQFSLRISAGKHVGREIPICVPRFVIGCADNCHLKVRATHVGPYHCELLIRDGGIWVRDYGNGTFVGGTRIVDRCRLRHGDQLQIGPLHFELVIKEAPLMENDHLPDECEILDILSQPVKSTAAPARELSDLGNAQSESPKGSKENRAASAEAREEADTADAAIDTLNKLYKTKTTFKATAIPRSIAAPPTSPPEEGVTAPASEGPQTEFAPGVSVSARTRRVIELPRWLFLADGRLNPNVMFALGVWVGIGLCSATITFWIIFAR